VNTTAHPIDRWSVYIAAGFLSFCGLMMFTSMPIVVSTLQRHYGFHESELGDIVGCYFGGICLVSLTTFAWIRRFDWRLTALVGQAISAVALLLAMSDRDSVQLSILLGAAGIGAGITYALSFTLLGDSDDPDRAFGVNFGFQTALGTLMFFTLPVIFSNDAGDMRRMLLAMVAAIVVSSVGIFWIPGAGRKDTPKGVAGPAAATQPGQREAIWLPLLGTMATFLFMLACTAPWVFIEQAAVAKNIDPITIGFSLGAAQFGSLVGSVIAAVIGNRFGKIGPMCIGAAIYLLGIYLLHTFHERDVFALGAIIFLLPINFLLAFSLGLTAEVDLGGRLIGLSTVSLLGPSLVAPSIAGRLYERYGFGSNLWIGVAAILIGLALYVGLLRVARRRDLSGADLKTFASMGAEGSPNGYTS
jgi:MFS family permease